MANKRQLLSHVCRLAEELELPRNQGQDQNNRHQNFSSNSSRRSRYITMLLTQVPLTFLIKAALSFSPCTGFHLYHLKTELGHGLLLGFNLLMVIITFQEMLYCLLLFLQ